MIESIDPEEINPLHEERYQTKLDELVDDMKENGWNGRPLLVIKRVSGGYQGWTGSHRIAAAREAELPVVPCYVVHERDLIERDLDPDWHVEDYERLNILREFGDEEAISLMGLEGRH
jgi:ParB-like chromosome segregation protein Spo0J